MDKKQAIQIIIKASKTYKNNLENKKILFLYGLSSEVEKQMTQDIEILSSIKYYEVAFNKYNFLHLTGVRINKTICSATHFYEKCVGSRLTEKDFAFSKDGTTVQKLDIINNAISIRENAKMIGNYNENGMKLFTEKIVGNVGGCIGFIKDKNTGLNVPNTLLKKDVRDISPRPIDKIFMILSKGYNEERYSKIERKDKSLDMNKFCFNEEIEKLIKRDSLL